MGFWAKLKTTMLAIVAIPLSLLAGILFVYAIPIVLTVCVVAWCVVTIRDRKRIVAERQAAYDARKAQWQEVRQAHPETSQPVMDSIRATFGATPASGPKPEQPVLPYQYEVVLPEGEYQRTDCPTCDTGFVIVHRNGTVHQRCPFCDPSVLETDRRPGNT